MLIVIAVDLYSTVVMCSYRLCIIIISLESIELVLRQEFLLSCTCAVVLRNYHNLLLKIVTSGTCIHFYLYNPLILEARNFNMAEASSLEF